jgi:hypothetical protein
MSAGATKPIAGARGLRRGSNRLIGFYDALAMIQAECFMNQWYSGGPVPVSDEDMQTLQWLHECVRNEYEHFVPKFFHAPRSSLAGAGTLCLHLASALLYNKHPVGRDGFAGLSSRIWTSENVDQRALKARFEQLITALDAAPVARPTAE